MRLSKGDAGEAPRDQAGVERVEAVKEAREPSLGSLGGL